MKKSKSLLFILTLIFLFTIAGCSNNEQSQLNPGELAVNFEKSAEEALGENVDKVSMTELAATMTYGHETDSENNIYYHILKTTYYEGGDPASVTGLNTDALQVLFPVEYMDSCEEMMIQDWHGALYKEDDTAYLCWTYDPEITYVLEYTPSKMPDSEILKMAESAAPIE